MPLPEVYVEVTTRLCLALAAGAAVGFERSYHGRPAGFRTHALVSLSTALLMLITVYQPQWFPMVEGSARTVLDPTRMAQGIMTGIGFLGAGVIVKERMAVRGLTTAASIWITASVGLMIGTGMYFPAALAVALALGTLAVFRWVERLMPTQSYALLTVRFTRNDVLDEEALRKLVAEHGFVSAHITYRLDAAEAWFEYTVTIRSRRERSRAALAVALQQLPSVRSFELVPMGT